MIQIDGSYLSGGGQILRTALALSLLTKKPFTIKDIRKARNNPGLRPQHLECVKICQEISNAKVEGAELNSTSITFIPKDIKKNKYHIRHRNSRINNTITTINTTAINITSQKIHLENKRRNKCFYVHAC